MNRYCFIDFETTGLDFRQDVPIEAAAILTDPGFVELSCYSALIAWPDLTNGSTWRAQFQKAADVHNISAQEYERDGIPPDRVVAELMSLCSSECETYLVSDNIHFDYGFMEVLFDRVGQSIPFHYHGFDTGLLFDVWGVADPDSVHRAMPDVRMIVETVRNCMNFARRCS